MLFICVYGGIDYVEIHVVAAVLVESLEALLEEGLVCYAVWGGICYFAAGHVD